MYYRYKPRKKNRKLLKSAIIFIVVFSLVYTGYTNRRKLMFWKMTQNRMVEEIKKAKSISSMSERIRALKIIKENMEVYKTENSLDPEAFIMSGNVNYLLGEAEGNFRFSELYINDSLNAVSANSKEYFLLAIKDLFKAEALLDGKIYNNRVLLVLAKSLFYTNYYSLDEISKIFKESVLSENVVDLEDVRFCSVVFILTGEVNAGLDFLKTSGKVYDTVQGQILYASALCDSKKYTEAIIAFKKIIASNRDNAVIRLAFLSLGKIYYNQHLYKESLEQFEKILKLDENDTDSKIWLGKNYLAMGNGDKAKAIWTEVLATSRGNEEVRKLLGLM